MVIFELYLPCPLLPTDFPEDPFENRRFYSLYKSGNNITLSLGSPVGLSVVKIVEDVLQQDPHELVKLDKFTPSKHLDIFLDSKELLERMRILITPLLNVERYASANPNSIEGYYKEIMYLINILCFFEENFEYLSEKNYRIHVYST